jgi:anti-anti-sigma factor
VPPPSTRPPEPATGPWFFCLRHPVVAQCIRIVIIGELRLATASRVRSVIRRAQDDAREVICDLGDVSSVDAFGAYVLVDAAARARYNGVRLTLVHSPPVVRRIFVRLGLDNALGMGARAPSPRGLPIAVRSTVESDYDSSRIVRPRFQRATRSRPRGRRPRGRMTR